MCFAFPTGVMAVASAAAIVAPAHAETAPATTERDAGSGRRRRDRLNTPRRR
jgi:hypothetical protein